MQCCAFYLKNVKDKKEFKAPMDNINANNLKSQIGDNFTEWANGYFLGDENFNVNIRRKYMQDDYKAKGGKQGSKKFKNA